MGRGKVISEGMRDGGKEGMRVKPRMVETKEEKYCNKAVEIQQTSACNGHVYQLRMKLA